MRSSMKTKFQTSSRYKRAKNKCKVDMGSHGNLVPLHIFKVLFPDPTLEQLVKKKVKGHILYLKKIKNNAIRCMQ